MLIGLLVAAIAELAPPRIAQTLDSKLLHGFAETLGRGSDALVIVNPEQPDALARLAAGSAVTVIGPRTVAVGRVVSSSWADSAAWLAAISLAFLVLPVADSQRRRAGVLAIAGPGLLVATSGLAFAAAAIWIPVAGPALFLLVTGCISIGMLKPAAIGPTSPVAPETARALLERGEPVESWESYRDLPPTRALLPELYALGSTLEQQGYPELAADSYLRIALVDPAYRDAASRLVAIRHLEHQDDGESLERLRSGMPARIGRYQLLEPIGQGASGRVYLARDPNINRLLAIKLIDLRKERDEHELADAIDHFRREAETTGRLSHPNIVTTYDMSEADGLAYIAMEYLKGERLSRYTTSDRLLPPSLVLELGALTADALDYAHSQNVIHRDIKPDNIMYDSVTGDLKITDFGIARLMDVDRTRTGIVLGTPSFMAPEQIEGGNVKGYTDLFSLGVTLYELLTGRLPFRGNSMTQLMFVIANEPHDKASSARRELPAALDAVIDKALSKDPAARFQRGADMADALRHAAAKLA